MTTLLKSATIIDASSPFHKQQKDILITNGFIEKIANSIPAKKEYEVVNYPNLHVSCGWFDTSVSFGEPGFEERETIQNGLLTAAKSGFTAVAITSNTDPIVDSKSAVEFLINKGASSNVDVFPIAALSKNSDGKEMAELYDMKQSGAIAFGDYNKPINNDNLLKIALQYAQNFDGLVLSFPKNNAIAGEGIVNEGVNSTSLGLKGAPALSEHLQIARDLFLLEYTEGKLHIPTISTAKSVQLIKDAKKKGLQVSCSVTPHHLTLTDDELAGFDSNVKVNPPLRTKSDTKALIKGVKDGTIDMITSDHNPIDIENKKLEFSLALDGTIGMESLFGAVHSVLDLETIIEKLTKGPRAVFGLEKTQIAKGAKANITLFNPDELSTFTEEHILSTSKNSAFIDKKLQGKAYGIYANNQLVTK
ncbi:dihydroorotase [Flavobacteriaceae bacterium S356]|uniref:Dihydroorotase n=1 Tax=Asprobacillus argus TaxID=3076534 RepID=A0ABU3LHK8_9FLAO|nr:dihydroorotase [Flavobacteriaceae bacterium S356]